MKNRNKIKLPVHGMNVRADFVPDTFNEENRTMEVVFSTGAKGKRGFWTEYFEELSMKKSDVRLERLNKGAPVLNNHSRFNGLEGILGVVEEAFIRNKEGIARIRFSERDELQGIIRDIQSGVIRNISVGYKVHAYKDVSKKGDEIPTLRAIDWEPMEISFVDIPFDMDSQSRSLDENTTYECTIERAEENDMNIAEKIREACKKAGLNDEVAENMVSREISLDEIDGEIKKALESKERSEETPKAKESEETPEADDESQRSDENPETPVVDMDKEREMAKQEERSRVNEINTVSRSLGIEADVTETHIKDGTSIDDFRKLAIETKAKQDQTKRTNNHNVEVTDMDQRKLRIEGAQNALLNRFKPGKYEITNEGTEFRFSSLIDLASRFLEAEGVNVRELSKSQIATRSLHTISDFKEILANTANKSLRDAYGEAPQTFAGIVNEVELDDFKEVSRTQLHSGAGLSELNEKGEYEHTTLSESAEKYSLGTFGKIVGITRKMIINDDMGAFTRVPQQFGLKARSLESKLVWAIINSNPLMADGFNLFSAEHGNLAAAGTAINVAAVNAGMSAMMLQKDLDDEFIDIMPSFLAGASQRAAEIKSFLGSTVPTQDSEVNPFKGDLDPLIERRLEARPWYLMATAQMIDMIEIARLRGESGPVVEQKEGFETDGLKLKVRYDFAAKVLDHRGFYKNPGNA